MEKIIHLRRYFHFGPCKIVMYLQRYHDVTIYRLVGAPSPISVIRGSVGILVGRHAELPLTATTIQADTRGAPL